jgi:hypothetical protein
MLIALSGAEASEFTAGSLTIDTPWSRATPGGAKVAGGYTHIRNQGTVPDRLMGGTLAVSSRSEVHETTEIDGVSRMRPLGEGLEIKPGQAIELKPGGHHLMFTDLQRPLKQGEKVTGTLHFEKAGTVAVEFIVQSIGAQSGPGAEHKH